MRANIRAPYMVTPEGPDMVPKYNPMHYSFFNDLVSLMTKTLLTGWVRSYGLNIP